MRIFVSGGCKNGKSTWAERLAARQCAPDTPLYYIATMLPADAEDAARIARHRAQRAGLPFLTVEQPRAVEQILTHCRADGSFLVDSLTALLANEMFSANGMDPAAQARVAAGLCRVLEAAPDLVLVSDGIASDAVRYDAQTERYRRALAGLDRFCAARCDAVLEVSAGRFYAHKGGAYVQALL